MSSFSPVATLETKRSRPAEEDLSEGTEEVNQENIAKKKRTTSTSATPQEWLTRLGLERFWTNFEKVGYTSVLMMGCITNDILDLMGIEELGPRELLKKASASVQLPQL